MIVVIADDLTGAAELGGIGLRYNLATEITNRVNPASKADLLVISTDTRSMSREAAEQVTEQLSGELSRLRPRLIYKKTDSVLRGHVLAEINIQKARLNLRKALLVAGNPGMGRTVVDGIYLLNGRPVHQSSFSEDPEFPITSSSVHRMLHSAGDEISVLTPLDTMPETGIVVGEVKDADDLAAWCGKIDSDTLVAGAAEFFTAILGHLNIRNAPRRRAKVTLQLPSLMICGSTFQKGYRFIHRMQVEGMPVSYIPEAILKNVPVNKLVYTRWIDDIIRYLKLSGKAIIAVDPAMKGITGDALSIRTRVAEAVALVASQVQINECLIEGGSTSAAVMRMLGVETLYPIQELAPGVIRMGVKGRKDFHITLKPGSYEWPSFLLHPELVEGTYEIDCTVF